VAWRNVAIMAKSAINGININNLNKRRHNGGINERKIMANNGNNGVISNGIKSK
jgi:hypothetical protein